MKCVIYKGKRKPDAYLYIRHEKDLSKVPESILDLMGTLQLVMSLDLTADSSLAKARAKDVLEKLESQGFYLQLPPSNTEMLTCYH